MNKIVNGFSIILLAAFSVIGMVIIFDLSVSNIHLKAMPYKLPVLSGLALLLFLVNLIRIRRRWQGVKDMTSFESFDFVTGISSQYMKKCRMFTILEMLFMVGALALFIRLSQLHFELMIVMIAVLLVLIIESMVFLAKMYKGGKAFRIGINNKVVAYFGREMHLFFYTGLMRVELHQKDLISFKYKKDLVLFLPVSVIEEPDREAFREALISQLNEKNIYFDDALRNWR